MYSSHSYRHGYLTSGMLPSVCLASLLAIAPTTARAQTQTHDHSAPTVQPASPATVPAEVRPSSTPSRDQYQIQARRLADRAPSIDGVLGDEAWRDAFVIDTFTQQEPNIGEPASERTEVRVVYDTNHLYIAVHAYDSDPDHLVATEMRRDSARLLDEDNFQIIFDTFRDSRSGYMFVTNPLGAKLEQQIFEEGAGNLRGASSNINKDWNGVWNAAARRTSDGWTAEIDIPMVTLRSPAVPVQTWGINFMRNIRRKNEQVYWAPIPKPYGLTQVSMAGTLTGMTDINRGLDLRIKPYALVGAKDDRLGTAAVRDGIRQVGLDVKYGLKAGLAADATVNTDFAQAEVDEQLVNLTRFAVFFPEKRDFFLENSGQFNVSTQGLERQVDLFYSRRIGLSDAGLPIPIAGGGRVTGKMPGGHNVAVMDLQTEDVITRPAENFLVARYSKDVSRRSRFGGLFINKEGIDSDRFNRTVAADGMYAPNASFSVQSFIAKTSTPGIDQDQQAFNSRVLFLNRKWNTYAEYTDIDNNFNPEVGFVPRRGIKTTKAHIERNPRPGGIIRVMEPMFNVIYTTDQTNRLLTRRTHTMLGTRFQNGAYLNGWWNSWFDRLDQPFAIQPGIIIPRGDYNYNEFMVMFSSSPARRLYGTIQYSPQTFYDGTRQDTTLIFGVRAAQRAAGEYSLARNDVDLPWGAFIVNLHTLRVDFAISPRQTIRNLTQYNTYTRQVTTSIRYNFIYRPGSDIYVVYDDMQLDTYGRPQVRNRQFVVKTTYLLSR